MTMKQILGAIILIVIACSPICPALYNIVKKEGWKEAILFITAFIFIIVFFLGGITLGCYLINS